SVDDIVLDDLIELRSGDQIAADGIVRATTALQVDESLLTGESDPVDKETGDHVLSGSFVVAGSGRFQATAVGDDAYARKLAVEAALGALAADEDRNATLSAIAAAFPSTDSWTRTGFVPFSSARKWSAATFGEHGTWVLGAPELVWAGRDGEVSEKAERLAATG